MCVDELMEEPVLPTEELKGLFSALCLGAADALDEARRQQKKVSRRKRLGEALLILLLSIQKYGYDSPTRAHIEEFFIDVLMECSYNDNELDWYHNHIGNFTPLCATVMGHCVILAHGDKLGIEQVNTQALQICSAVKNAAARSLQILQEQQDPPLQRSAKGVAQTRHFSIPVVKRATFSVIKGGKP